MNRTGEFVFWFLIVSLVSSASFAQWQKIGKEQLPDNLGEITADSLVTATVKSPGTGGVSLEDGSGASGVFISEGGNVGIRNTNPAASLDISGPGILLPVGQPIGWNVYYNSGWKHKTDGYGSYILTRFDNGDLTFFTTSNGSAGSSATVSERWRIRNDGTQRYGNDTVLEFSYDTGTNEFRYGNGQVLRIDADNGNLISDGDLDFAGSGEFGDSTHTLTRYQTCSEAQPGFGTSYDYQTDFMTPTSTGVERYVAVPCPRTAPGTRIKSVKFIVYLNTSADHVNFAVKRQTTADPGTTSDLVSFAGTDFTQSTMTLISGDYYYRTETLDFTISSGEKLWAVVDLYAGSVSTDCGFRGAEWTFEQRSY